MSKVRPMVVNRSGPVLGDDGKRLYGMDAELHLKMKAKEDPDWEKQVGKWVAEVTGEKINVDNLHEALSDGQVLIKLVNTLKPGTITNWNRIHDPTHPKTALASTGNIRLYLAAVMAMGVPGVDMFLVDDLRTGRAMTMVCRNLASLCRLAVRDMGWKGPSIGPRLATPGPKTWADVEFNPYQQPDETPQNDIEETLNMYKDMLEKEHEGFVQAMTREAHMKHEVEKMKRQIKQYRLEHEQFIERLEASQQTAGSAAVKDFAAAVNHFGDPNLPDHLQPVEKSDADELERKAQRRVRRINSEHEATRKSSEAIGEWQEKVNKVKRKMDIKQKRRMSFTDQVDSPVHDVDYNDDVVVDVGTAREDAPLVDEGGGVRRRQSPISRSPTPGTPSKTRHGHGAGGGGISRRTLIVMLVVESVVLLGLAGGFAWAMYERFGA